ncbi:hypothetical protein PHLGIDRAFT_120351 [Phlebiopsis gigantea 11061_1 CR5-6]|uniref:Uncharacterized protein n=1 Tax=Phlebiopsis gigantea (strain 11061_1 CR5-6) TaxID=745531 RepID=A0A0C3PGJ6_PHLG1|nr:hypothetical protein PHLGIDRAFT_120351 [Phlebiopsis gigantea 11061_1 CR5-6]
MPISLVKAQLIGTLVEGLFYGMYVVAFAQSLRIFYWRRRQGRNMWWLSAVSIVIFVLITIYLVIDFIRVVSAFAENTGTPDAALRYYDSIDLRQRFVRVFAYSLLTLITDAIIVYRTYIVWARNLYICAVPALLVVTDLAFAIWVLDSLMRNNGPVPLSTYYATRVKYYYIITLVVNVTCSALISWKIWSTHRALAKSAIAGVRFLGVMAVILESAAVYSCLLIVLIATTVTRSYSTWIALTSVGRMLPVLSATTDRRAVLPPQICPAIGMIFSTVMVRSSREYHTDTFLSNDIPGLSAPLSTDPPVPPRALLARTPDPPTRGTFRISFEPHEAGAPRRKPSDVERGHARSSSSPAVHVY